jgi:secondary thiamine-phosphate synthase enzyme
MPFIHHRLTLETDQGVGIYNLTPQIEAFLATTSIIYGQVIVFSCHTTTALAINEDESRLLEDIKTYLHKLAPVGDRYLHNDLHLREVPANEPQNAHAHLMAITLSTSEVIPVVDGQLALGTYQSILLLELDGPRQRTVLIQVSGE